MKVLTILLAVSGLALCSAHGPDGDTKPSAKPSPTQVVALKGKTATPAGCRKLSTDADWPSEAEWKAALPKIISRSPTLAKNISRPDYKLRAESVADVQAAVKFCSKNNIRLTLINSGHDFLGRNDAPSGLSLDTSLLGGIKVLESFTPTTAGAASPEKAVNTIVPVRGKQAAVTFGVGVSGQRLHNALNPSKLVSIGAAHGSVTPAGGFGQTAGHGPLSIRYGLAVDQFLEIKVVTADGELKVANKVSNPDLFWALRGGGGSTFGVVVEATVKAHPDVPITTASFNFNTTNKNDDGLWDAYAYLHKQFDSLVAQSISGYYYIYPGSMRGIWLHQANYSGKANVEKVWTPILAKMSSFPGIPKITLDINEFDSYKAYFDNRFGAIDKGESGPEKAMPWDVPSSGKMALQPRHGPGMEMKEPEPNNIVNLDSRLIGPEHLKHPNLTSYLRFSTLFGSANGTVTAASPGILQGHLVAGGKVWNPDDDVSVLPAWRKAYTHLIGYKAPGVAGVDSLRQLAPESGAYANEAYPLEENWKQTFWGSNYEKLSQIKSKYDPNMVFWVTPGINADHMEARQGRLCKLEKPSNSKSAPLTDNPNNGRIIGSVN